MTETPGNDTPLKKMHPAQYPESVWLDLFGFYISRDHYRNKVAPRGFEFSEKNLYTREMFDERRKKAGEAAR